MSTEWNETKNTRRCHLIDLHVDGMLTDEEVAELEKLQSEMLAYRRQVAPLPIEDARAMRDELLRKYLTEEEVKDGFKGFNKQIEKSWKNIQATALLWVLWDRNDQLQSVAPTMFRICLNPVRVQKREGGGFEYHVFDDDLDYMKAVKFDFLRQLFRNFGILSGPFVTWNQFLLTSDNDVRYFSINLDGATNKLLLTEYPVRVQQGLGET